MGQYADLTDAAFAARKASGSRRQQPLDDEDDALSAAVDATLEDEASAASVQRGRAALAVRFHSDADPARKAAANQLARRYGLPPGVAEIAVEELQGRAAMEDALSAFGRSPRLGSWIADQPARAKLVHDDIQPLSDIEVAVRALKNTPTASASGFIGTNAGLWGFMAAPFEIAGQGFRAVEDAIAETFGAPRGMGSNAGEAIGGFFRREQAAANARAQRVGPQVTPDAGVIERGYYSGISSATQSLLTLPLALVTGGSSNLALATQGAVASGPAYARAREAIGS